MIQALNMELEPIRTVLKNNVNEIMVCRDQKRDSGEYYTIISINDTAIRKKIAGKIAGEGLFSSNGDFIGSFVHRDSLNLVFLYQRENRLCNQEAIYGQTFADRKKLATNLLIACAETEITGALGILLIQDYNINVFYGCRITFNYFLDFQKWNPEDGETDFYRHAANYAFGIMSREYQVRLDGDFMCYPKELQLFYRKTQQRNFHSFNHILTFIKTLPDRPSEQHTGFRMILDRLIRLKSNLSAHATPIFLSVILTFTALFTGYQMFTRLTAKSNTQENTMYIGMDRIGEVYLGDEEV